MVAHVRECSLRVYLSPCVSVVFQKVFPALHVRFPAGLVLDTEFSSAVDSLELGQGEAVLSWAPDFWF